MWIWRGGRDNDWCLFVGGGGGGGGGAANAGGDTLPSSNR